SGPQYARCTTNCADRCAREYIAANDPQSRRSSRSNGFAIRTQPRERHRAGSTDRRAHANHAVGSLSSETAHDGDGAVQLDAGVALTLPRAIAPFRACGHGLRTVGADTVGWTLRGPVLRGISCRGGVFTHAPRIVVASDHASHERIGPDGTAIQLV